MPKCKKHCLHEQEGNKQQMLNQEISYLVEIPEMVTQQHFSVELLASFAMLCMMMMIMMMVAAGQVCHHSCKKGHACRTEYKYKGMYLLPSR